MSDDWMLEAVRILDAIEQQRSFAAAARALHRVPSALTYSIQKIEQRLGVALFDRSGHRAQMTAAGRELLREGRLLLQATQRLQSRVQRVAGGWESELRIALDILYPRSLLASVLSDFYALDCGTRLSLTTEVLAGSWDALLANRADLVVGATGEGPSGGGYQTHALGELEMVFAVAPQHPLASLAEPLAEADIESYRAVVIADSSRYLSPRSVGILSAQDTITVPDMLMKLQLQREGLGVGSLPRPLAEREAAAGRLLIKRVDQPLHVARLHLAWRRDSDGRALSWLRERIMALPMLSADMYNDYPR